MEKMILKQTSPERVNAGGRNQARQGRVPDRVLRSEANKGKRKRDLGAKNSNWQQMQLLLVPL